jgi:hypothetical protein
MSQAVISQIGSAAAIITAKAPGAVVDAVAISIAGLFSILL